MNVNRKWWNTHSGKPQLSQVTFLFRFKYHIVYFIWRYVKLQTKHLKFFHNGPVFRIFSILGRFYLGLAVLLKGRLEAWIYYWAHDMILRIFRIRMDEFINNYFSVEKGNKFLVGQKMHFFSVLSIWENQNEYYKILLKIRKFVLGKFVKTCSELDHYSGKIWLCHFHQKLTRCKHNPCFQRVTKDCKSRNWQICPWPFQLIRKLFHS